MSVYKKYIPVPVSLSYLKLLGKPYQSRLLNDPPGHIVFDMHMHDLYVPQSCRELSFLYRMVYGRGRETGGPILRSLLDRLAAEQYDFSLLSSLLENTRKS
jgi:hypothetical protein